MKFTLFLVIPLFLYGTSSFITPLEYASQFYKNPRGIGCQQCHGDNGKGKLIANYMHENIKKSFRGPEIDKISFGDFYKALNRQKNGMPRYYLTQKEIEALYLYLHQKDKMDD
jgi:mono/diheme cytochrome c family protein